MQEGKAGFPRTARLLTPAVYGQVFKRSQRSTDKYFTVLYLHNDVQNARLGMAVAKKVLKRAVDRNLVKRQIRESFRRHLDDLAGFDLVVLCKRGISLQDKAALRSSLARHWKRVAGDKKN